MDSSKNVLQFTSISAHDPIWLNRVFAYSHSLGAALLGLPRSVYVLVISVPDPFLPVRMGTVCWFIQFRSYWFPAFVHYWLSCMRTKLEGSLFFLYPINLNFLVAVNILQVLWTCKLVCLWQTLKPCSCTWCRSQFALAPLHNDIRLLITWITYWVSISLQPTPACRWSVMLMKPQTEH